MPDVSHLLENLVFTGLRRQFPDIYYYKAKTGKEVDFIVPKRDRSKMLVQVCETLADPKTRKREIAALIEAMAEQKQKSGTIVTKNETGQIETDSGSIVVAPVWRFLLDQASAQD